MCDCDHWRMTHSSAADSMSVVSCLTSLSVVSLPLPVVAVVAEKEKADEDGLLHG